MNNLDEIMVSCSNTLYMDPDTDPETVEEFRSAGWIVVLEKYEFPKDDYYLYDECPYDEYENEEERENPFD